MGYEMYRLLSSKKPHLQKQPKSRKKGSQIIDVEEEDRDKNLLVGGYKLNFRCWIKKTIFKWLELCLLQRILTCN